MMDDYGSLMVTPVGSRAFEVKHAETGRVYIYAIQRGRETVEQEIEQNEEVRQHLGYLNEHGSMEGFNEED